MSIAKRSFLIFLSSVIVFLSVQGSYYRSVEAAEWIGGAIAAVGGAPIVTALVIGGVVVAGGVALYELSQTSPEDHRQFVNGIKTGFQEFVADQEATIAKENDQSLTDQEAADIGIANARETVDNFMSNAVDVTVTTGKKLKAKTAEYWKKFSNEISDVADNGISVDTTIGENTPVTVPIYSTEGNQGSLTTNIGGNCISIDGNYYIQKGQTINRSVDMLNSGNIPFQTLQKIGDVYYARLYYVNAIDNTLHFEANNGNFSSTQLQTMLAAITIPIVIFLNNENLSNIMANWRTMLSVSRSNVSSVPSWKNTLNATLTQTRFGNAISTGRRQLVQSGDYVGSRFKDNSIPVKRSGVRTNEGTVSAQVGWDIPSDSVYDDVLEGVLPWQRVYEGTGAIEIPDNEVKGYEDEGTRVIADEDADVDDPADDPADPEPEDPDWEDILDEQGGEFYPAGMDLTELFPFCIPFDFIYLVNKMYVNPVAPVITIDYVYPSAIQPVLGEAYHLVIDFNDFVTLRNIIRVFLLLMFIVGLMKITRDLIRG